MKGHPPKSTAELKIAGTYRPDRHGDRQDEQICGGKPSIPDDLGENAVKYWRGIVDGSPEGVYGIQDVSLLVQYCELAAKFDELWDEGELDASLKVSDRTVKLATKLGIGPVERTRIRFKETKPKDDFEAWEQGKTG